MSAARKKRQLSRHARGYTNAHVARRRQLEPLVATGQVNCCRCGQLIQPGQAWHLDHQDDRRGYLGPSHATCNLRAAAHKTNSTRQDQQLIWSRVWYEPIPPNVILSRDADTDLTASFKSDASSVPRSTFSLPEKWMESDRLRSAVLPRE